jgi:hypothetical protein
MSIAKNDAGRALFEKDLLRHARRMSRSGKPFALGVSTNAPRHLCKRPVRQLYMLHDQVWQQTGAPSIDGNMHVGCVEKRLGRKLTRRDFYYQDVGTKVRR